jgi:hypothetical protein
VTSEHARATAALLSQLAPAESDNLHRCCVAPSPHHARVTPRLSPGASLCPHHCTECSARRRLTAALRTAALESFGYTVHPRRRRAGPFSDGGRVCFLVGWV